MLTSDLVDRPRTVYLVLNQFPGVCCDEELYFKLLIAWTQLALSQNAHRRVKIVIFTSLWVPIKGQSGEILLGVNNSIM